MTVCQPTLFNIGNAYTLFSRIRSPLLRQTSREPAADVDMRIGRYEPVFSASNPNTGIFISFMASTNRKNQLLRSTSTPFQHQAVGFFLLHKLRMQAFSWMKFLSFPVSMYDCGSYLPGYGDGGFV